MWTPGASPKMWVEYVVGSILGSAHQRTERWESHLSLRGKRDYFTRYRVNVNNFKCRILTVRKTYSKPVHNETMVSQKLLLGMKL